MMQKVFFLFPALLIAIIIARPSLAQDCGLDDRLCILKALEATADQIETVAWRDQVYREIAKTLAFEGQTDDALRFIDKIQTPDTQAMTIRGIGMAAADKGYTPEEYDTIFTKLHTASQKISDPPSHAIALTYIAMSQAFAGDNEGAWKTASGMENEALRHKAYAETAEIQAARGDYDATMKSIQFIESPAFRNKAYEAVSKIFADGTKLEQAYKSALLIQNPYKKSQALQYMLDAQKPREVSNK